MITTTTTTTTTTITTTTTTSSITSLDIEIVPIEWIDDDGDGGDDGVRSETRVKLPLKMTLMMILL